nr:PQQ-binding-like beta-propeller repeat protein [Candidatus Dependentiae bacterium]
MSYYLRVLVLVSLVNSTLMDFQIFSMERVDLIDTNHISRAKNSSSNSLVSSNAKNSVPSHKKIEIKAHTDRVFTVAVSSNGKIFLTGSNDKTACAWNASTGNQLSMIMRKEPISSVACSPDGKTMFTGSCDGISSLSATETGSLLHWLKGHTGFVTVAAFNHDGTTLLTGLSKGNSILWDVSTGALLWNTGDDPLLKKQEPVTAVAFSRDNKIVFTASYGGSAALWDSTTGEKLVSFKKDVYHITSALFAPDNETLLIGMWSGQIFLLNRNTGASVMQFEWYHKEPILSLAVSLHHKAIFTCSSSEYGFITCFWDVETGKRLKSYKENKCLGKAAALGPEGASILFGSKKGEVRMCDLSLYLGMLPSLKKLSNALIESESQGKMSREFMGYTDKKNGYTNELHEKSQIKLEGHTDSVTAVSFRPDGKAILTGSRDTTARLWDASTGKLLTCLKHHTDQISSVAFSSDGKIAITGSYDTTACLWAEGGLKNILTGHTKGVSAVACSPDGKLALTGSFDATTRLWDAETGKCIYILKENNETINLVAFSPDGKSIVTASSNKTITLFTVKTGKKIKSFNIRSGFVTAVLFTDKGTALLAGLSNGEVILLNLNTGGLELKLERSVKSICLIAHSADASLFFTGSVGYNSHLFSMRLFDSVGGQHLLTHSEEYQGTTGAAAISPDYRSIVIGSSDGTARICGIRARHAWSEKACSLHGKAIVSAAFSPDGTIALTGSQDTSTWLW